MKQCDRGLSPFAIGSSSLSFPASESDPEDSYWRDFAFDFSFLTSDDQKSGLGDDGDDDSLSNLSRHANATALSKAEESELYGLNRNAFGRKEDFAGAVRDERFELEIRTVESSDSFLKLPNNLEIDLKGEDSQPRISSSLDVVSTSHFDSSGTTVEGYSQLFPPSASALGVTSITPLPKSAAVVDNKNNCGDTEAEGRLPSTNDKAACSGNILVSKDINESNSSPLFSKMAALRIKRCSSGSGIDKAYIPGDQDDTELDSPCWRGIQSHDNAASGTKSWNFRRSGDDLNSFHRLNPLAPHFIPSSAKKNLDNNGKVFEENGSSSLKRSLSSTFPLSSGEFSISSPSEAGIEQDSEQKDRAGILIHEADESLGLVSQEQDSISKTMNILDITSQFQSPKKLDPLAPVFVPASAKLSAVVLGDHGATDHVIAIETNTSLTSGFSSSDKMLSNSVKIERHSSEVDTRFRKGYSGSSVHESGTKYSFAPRFGSQFQISENSELDSSSNKFHGQKKLNPLAPQFSLAGTKQNTYGSVLATKQMGCLSPSLKVQPTMEVPPFHISGTAASSSSSDVKALSDSGQRYGCSTSSPSPKMDVKKLLTTIHELSELLIHVQGSESSDSPNEQDLDLINCTVQNLNSYMNNRVQGHTGNYATAVHSSYDTKLSLSMLKPLYKQSLRGHKLQKAQNMTYSMVSGEMVPDSHSDYGVGEVMGNYQAEDQINPQVYFYKSLWLKAKADTSLMEYERFLSETRNLSN